MNYTIIIEQILGLGVEHLPTVTVCACLWVLVRRSDASKKKDK